ncbi:general transcription factor 3C polypeptide 3 [Glossina fuscipes]|uniref:General transcription factor 3C polypeptide 3 n=1 Tax=Glossina fuscipes TaxID=7396 RepID=A0A9C5YTD2_9MUSC|nr:general transcription factor 3C polypeptide 3 [Glossina fuscipes]XP_037887822.1 general transcription factor 3C polypeptide 3 [Glossina fuscipes]
MDTSEVVIEEIDSNAVPESELSEFQETQPLKVLGIYDDVAIEIDDDEEEDEGSMIKKFIHGEAEFPDIYTKLESEEEEEEEEDIDNANETIKEQQQDMMRDLLEPSTSVGKNAKEVETDLVMEDTIGDRKSRLHLGGGRRRPFLNVALQGLMGEANLSFARGQTEMAEKICLEIIRQDPLAAEPFFTLAHIYESRDTEKYLNFLTIAVHLNPSDRFQWIRIAEMHIAQGNLQRARLYYTRAIKVHMRDYDLRLRKARLLETMGEQNASMITYLKMIRYLPPERAELCLVTAKNVARHFHALNKSNLALEAMQNAYEVCGQKFSLEDLNLYMELLILNKEHAKVLQCLKERTDLRLEKDNENNLDMMWCVIPDDYIPDFRAKLCVTLVALKAHHLLGYLIQNVHEHIPVVNERVDLYIDIAEALMQEHKYAEAISLLRPIVDGDFIDCPPFVWLRQAECLRHLNRTTEAIESYAKVVELAPFCYEAKFTLSALLKQQGRHVEAVKALEQSGEGEGQPLHARLLYERCIMLQQLGKIDEFLEVGCVLLGRQSIKLRTREEMLAAANGGSCYNAEGLKVILQMRNIIGDEAEKALEIPKSSPADNLTIHDEYQLFLELMRTGFYHRKFSAIERVCFAVVTTKRFAVYHTDLVRIIILSCYFNDDNAIAFSYLRELIHKNVTHIPQWNLLSLMIQKGQDLRYHRYMSRLISRQPVARQMRIFIAHYHFHCSSFKYALNVYAPIFKEYQQPIVALCIAVIFNQISLQKKILRKCAAVSQSIMFAHKYASLRRVDASGDDNNSAASQEINYNIGRIYHQANMMHLAVEYYEKALACQHPLIEEHSKYLSLKQEIAFNLHLIYKSNGNLAKARHYLYEYCVV